MVTVGLVRTNAFLLQRQFVLPDDVVVGISIPLKVFITKGQAPFVIWHLDFHPSLTDHIVAVGDGPVVGSGRCSSQ